MTLPIWAKAWTSDAFSLVPPAPRPVTPHVEVSEPFLGTALMVCAGVPELGIAANVRSLVRNVGLMNTCVNGEPYAPPSAEE